jgi:chaperonin GroES
MTNITPLGDKVFIKPIEEEEKTKSGFYLPESAKEKPKRAEVLAVGEGKYIDGKLVPLSVKVGQKILIKEWGGDEIKLDGETYKIIEEDNILAIIE